MNATLIYLLKVNIAIVLFYLFYKVFFSRDTFLTTRRIYLLLSVLISFIYPVLSVQHWLEKQKPMQDIVQTYVQLQEITILPIKEPSIINAENVMLAVYISVVLGLLFRFLWQFLSVYYLFSKSKQTTIQQIEVYTIERTIAPFSFFGRICINPLLHTETETKQILAHELTHVKQLHSVDVIISELLCIVFWFNPATWLMKREIRQNLEYLADNQVIQSGFDTKSYQYHLLQLSYQTPQLHITNKFNVLPLKKRIKMMNQKKSSKTSLLKYLLVLPLASALIVSSNAETIINSLEIPTQQVFEELKSEDKTIQEKPSQKTKQPESKSTPTEINEVVVVGYGAPDATTDDKPKVNTTEINENTIFMVVEKMPQFPGGDSELMKYLGQNIRYPVSAMKNGTQGRVICQFVVDKDGSITNVEVVRSVDAALDAEAVRVITAMPKWIAGEQRGEKVRVKYVLPINFRMQDGNPIKKKDIEPAQKQLIVLDGEVMPENFDLKNLNPANIKSLDVLKDASAVELYGEKGKNGVILITTKK